MKLCITLTKRRELVQEKYLSTSTATSSQTYTLWADAPGNLTAIPILVEGMTVDEIESKLKDVKCGYKDTSCAGQLAKAVREAKNAEKK